MAFLLKNNQWCLTSRATDFALNTFALKQNRPVYLYDLEQALLRAEALLKSPFSVHFAMKANSCPRLLRQMAQRGLGVDVVSLGEMQKALSAGFSPKRLIFSGVAKEDEELSSALAKGIFQINVESFPELQLLHQVCQREHRTAQVALRLNIHLSAPTHQHVQTTTPDSKFGIDLDQLPEILAWLKNKPEIQVLGIATHIGSQITDVEIFGAMAKQMGEIYGNLKRQGLPLERLDLGGGLGIDYHSDGAEDLSRAEAYLRVLEKAHGTDAQVLIEPGRFLVARMGVLLSKVIYIKKTSAQNFAILNAGMNCLMRPALYEAFHRIEALSPRPEQAQYTVVGPICESTDKFAVDRPMTRLERGDWVAIFDAGAYGQTMANTYNESPLPAEWSVLDGVWEIS